MSEKKCEERIEEHLESRIDLLAEALENEEHDPNDILLSHDIQTVHKVMLSWGGPSDFFNVYVDNDKEIVQIDYHFQDWFDGARRTLEGKDFAIAKEYCEMWLGIGEWC